VHSERSPDTERARRSSLHGIQIWVALPEEREESAPAFVHYGTQALPELEVGGARLRLLAGEAFGAKAGVETASPLFYIEAELGAGPLRLEAAMGQRAAYIVDGRVETGGRAYEAGRLLVFADGTHVTVCGLPAAKLMLFGGPRLAGDRHVWWNFVSSSVERIEAAKRAWRERTFPAVPGDDGYMPLPGEPSATLRKT
jgi:redox-sensitive bicupin YhaK (pirin superfamily)